LAFVAKDHLDQIVVQTAMIRPEPRHQFGNVQSSLPLTGEAVDRKACAGFELLAGLAFIAACWLVSAIPMAKLNLSFSGC
jgi:hypothetical protein